MVLKTHNRLELQLAAEPLGLYTGSADAPLTTDGRPADPDRWMVIGRDRSSVQEKIREISREALRGRQRAQDAKDKKIRKLHEDVKKKAAKAGPANVWNITGSWSIKCPYLEENWGHGTDECTLDIYTEERKGGRQMWADFDFIIITGVFRFEKLNSTPSKPAALTLTPARASRKRAFAALPDSDDEEGEDDDNDDDDDEDDEDDDNDDDDDGPTPQAFFLSPNDHHSSRHAA